MKKQGQGIKKVNRALREEKRRTAQYMVISEYWRKLAMGVSK